MRHAPFGRQLAPAGIGLLLVAAFLFANIESIEGGVGSGYLVAAAACCGIACMPLQRAGAVRLRTSSWLLVVFLAYFLVMLATGFDDAVQIKAYTIGTSGGLFFALVFGMLAWRLVGGVSDAATARPAAARRAQAWQLLFVLLSVALSLHAFTHYFVDVRSDLFVIQQDDDGHLTGYQRVGNYIAIAFILDCTLLARMYPHRRAAPFLFWCSALLSLILAFVLMPLAQLVASNSGFALVAGFLVFTLMWLFVVRKPGFPMKRLRIRLRDLLLGWLGRRMLVAALLSVAGLVVVGLLALAALDIPVDSFRILGFGNDAVDSFDSRAEIFRENFITQFSYNPLFGNMRVDLLTTGQGTYVHSLLSLLTHLGLVGFTLFVLFLRSLYLQIARPDQRPEGELKKSYLLFRLLALVAVLLAGLVSAFFVWTPLWFCVGLFAFGSNAPAFAPPAFQSGAKSSRRTIFRGSNSAGALPRRHKNARVATRN